MTNKNNVNPAPVHLLVGQTDSIEECWRDFILGDLGSGFDWALHPMLCNRSEYMERFIKSAKDEIDRLREVFRVADQWDRATTYEDKQAHLSRLHSVLRRLPNVHDNRASEAGSGSSPCSTDTK